MRSTRPEDRIERGSEVRAAVADHELDPVRLLVEVHEHVAGLLSTHTVAFHLRHVFWKLGVTSRVQLARMSAEQAATGS